MAYPSILLIHGGITAAWIWDLWREQLREQGWEVNVLDLRGHGHSLPVDLATITMEDYVADVASVAAQIAAVQGRQPIVGGWAMGGLVAMMHAATQPDIPGLLLFAPSPPLEVAGRGEADVVRATPSGPFGPELYGLHPDDAEASREALHDLTEEEARGVLERVRDAQESGMARRQRRRGVSLAPGAIRAPSLILFGEQDAHFTPEYHRSLAIYLAGDAIAVPQTGHWGIVCHGESVSLTAPRVDDWLRANVPQE
ncbi:MAG TPA: alpha/beta hydrolase [Dehalococcoidia bacterium]|nr:alpha/beta hydrolase [Dehalococcoidia bacterium]